VVTKVDFSVFSTLPGLFPALEGIELCNVIRVPKKIAKKKKYLWNQN
jgi:hypothetical protein